MIERVREIEMSFQNIISDYLWKPIFSAAADSIKEILGNADIQQNKRMNIPKYSGINDFWYRGIVNNTISINDKVKIDCLLSPYSQLFPGSPFINGVKWNLLYTNDVDADIRNNLAQTLSFYINSDLVLRMKSIADRSIVGLYDRYGYAGDGLIGIIPEKLLLSCLPAFYSMNYWGARVVVEGVVRQCPAEHLVIVKDLAQKGSINIDSINYHETLYLDIQKIHLFNKDKDKTSTLTGTVWAVTLNEEKMYEVRYGYLNNSFEMNKNISELLKLPEILVFGDDVAAKANSTFSRMFLI